MRQPLWLLIAPADQPDLHLALPTVAWMAAEAGAAFECYLEAERDGTLFARSGSTVLGGAHHQQLNYLHARFDVRYIHFGETHVFSSTIRAFGAPALARAASLPELYRALGAEVALGGRPLLLAPPATLEHEGRPLEIGPYLFPEIFFRRALALPAALDPPQLDALGIGGDGPPLAALLAPADEARWRALAPGLEVIDTLRPGDGYGSITLRIAGRWKHLARGVAFGDPAAVWSLIPAYCREGRVALYEPAAPLPPAEVRVAPYPEERSPIAEEVGRLAEEVGNRVLVGRQTGDGDLFTWARRGVAMQIMDPNRPAFQIVETLAHPWAPGDLYGLEPDDAQLARWADEGRILAALLVHSGEMAHNEAMLNLVELAGRTGLRLGIGVHAARYETCPQLWELISVPRERGGARGLVEPLLHAGGLGVMAEANCPPGLLREHCEQALARIRRVAGDGATPRGYYAFMDADLATLAPGDPDLYGALGAAGLEYGVSSALPGRNRIIADAGGCLMLNQTCRTVYHSSPFIRVTTLEEILECAPRLRPGWLIGTIDAPVIGFLPYIWREGRRFMRIVDWLRDERNVVNVTPRTVSRYARLLRARGVLPEPAARTTL